MLPARLARPDPAPRVPWRAVGAFVAIAFALMGLGCVPLWLDRRLLRPGVFQLYAMGLMVTPSLAVAAVVLAWRERGVARATGLPLALRRSWRYGLFAWLAMPLFCLAAPFVGAALGVVQLDLRDLSGFRAVLASAGPAAQGALPDLPLHAILAVQVATGVLLGPLLNAPFALGEEWAWRGWLLPKLLPLGTWPALLLSGAIWGAWHAPVILLGYNYPSHPRLGVLLMIATCLVHGVLLGWLRLASGSLWPAVVAHAGLNALAGLAPAVVRAGTPFDSAQAGMNGWTGWILPVATVAVLVALGRLPPREAPAAAPVRRR